MKPRVIKARDGEQEKSAETQVMREVIRPRIKPESLADKLANDTFFHKNYMYFGGEKQFPNAREMHYVERYYPHAEGGPLAVDYATDRDDINTMMLKKPILAERGVRYVCIKYGMSEAEVMEQLALDVRQ